MGVLHHLADPVRGLKSLVSVLESDGVIALMLYGRYGRHGIYLLQEFFRRIGLGQTPADIQLVRQTFSALHEGHPAKDFAAATDMTYDAGLTDLFLHEQDRAYTVAECLNLVSAAGLSFQGWIENVFYYPDGQLPRGHPLHERLEQLSDAELWQAMELFQGKISKHQFLACRATRERDSYAIDFSSDRLLDLVPVSYFAVTREVRADGSITVKHAQFPAVTVRNEMAALVRAIDGQRSVRACYEAAGVPFNAETSWLIRFLWRLDFYRILHPAAAHPIAC
jgi:hypothetical protein